jgi:uncharacterized protein (DUF302 family)
MRVMMVLLFALAVPFSSASANELTVKPSKHTVKETVDRLTSVLKEKGITPAARIDHSAAAKTTGQALRPTEVLVFGNPKLGTPLMQTNRHIAIDLPMRVLVWEDDAGKVWIGYSPPSALKARYKLDGRDEIFKALTGALEAFTDAAAN